jgi:hypothetical protein
MASENFVLQRVTSSPGRGSTTCWRWRWVGVEEGEVLETTTDSTMRNWVTKGWKALSEDPRPWGVYTNIHASGRKTNQGVQVANADHRAVIEHRFDDQDAAKQAVDWIKKSLKPKSDNTNFDNLFYGDDE